MTDLEPYTERTPATQLVDWGTAARAAHDLAKALTQTTFAPDHFRGKPVEAMAAILAGAEVGLSPLQALNSTFVIGGKPAYYARTMVALVQAQGHEVWTKAESPSSVTVCGRRRGSEQVETVTVTMEQARRAGWTRNKKYDSEPAAMLYARAASAVCRRVAADALLGIPYTAEELVDEAAAPEPKRTVKRGGRQVEAPAVEASVAPGVDASPVPPAPQESTTDEEDDDE